MNQKVSKTAHIKELNQEIDRLKAELFCTREKNGVYMPAELFQQREQVRAALLQRCASHLTIACLKSCFRSCWHLHQRLHHPQILSLQISAYQVTCDLVGTMMLKVCVIAPNGKSPLISVGKDPHEPQGVCHRTQRHWQHAWRPWRRTWKR